MLFSPWFIITSSYAWGYLAYLTARRETLRELNQRINMPPWLALTIASAIALSVLLPRPWDFSVALAIAGLSVAAWNDWHTNYLWDEVVVTTALLCGVAMLLGGQGATSMQGGILCGALTAVIYFSALAFGKQTGFGDVKHAAAIGFAIGPIGGIAAYIAAAIIFLISATITAAVHKSKAPLAPNVPVAFGPALTLGFVVSAALLPQLSAFLQSLF